VIQIIEAIPSPTVPGDVRRNGPALHQFGSGRRVAGRERGNAVRTVAARNVARTEFRQRREQRFDGKSGCLHLRPPRPNFQMDL
jgi:hypothetical protein